MTLKLKVLLLLITIAYLSPFYSTPFAQKVELMSVETLKSRLNLEDTVVVDVRRGKDWSDSPSKIKGARRIDANNLTVWAKDLSKTRSYIFYCA